MSIFLFKLFDKDGIMFIEFFRFQRMLLNLQIIVEQVIIFRIKEWKLIKFIRIVNLRY
jgi:hypothetical protein